MVQQAYLVSLILTGSQLASFTYLTMARGVPFCICILLRVDLVETWSKWRASREM